MAGEPKSEGFSALEDSDTRVSSKMNLWTPGEVVLTPLRTAFFSHKLSYGPFLCSHI